MVRFKNRYILCEIIDGNGSEEVLKGYTDKQVYRAIREALEEVHGQYGLAVHSTSLNVKYLNPLTRMVLIRARRDAHKMVTTSLPFAKLTVKGTFHPVFRILHIGGTIRSCQKFMVKYHRNELTNMLAGASDPEERKKIQELLLTCSKEEKGMEEIIEDTPAGT